MKLRKNKNKRLIKAANRFQPFDYGFVLSLEKEAISSMYEYFKTNKIAVGDERTEKQLRLALQLLDVILEEDFPQSLAVYVNTKNIARFVPEHANIDCENRGLVIRDNLRLEKAWRLYCRLREDFMRSWWN